MFFHPKPPQYLIGMYPPNMTYRNVRPKSGSSYSSPQKGRDSLSLYLFLSRSGWFHDEVAKQLIKVRTTGSNSGSNEYGTTKVLTGPRPNIRLTTYLDLEYWYWSMHDRVRWERPRQARVGPCRALPTDSTSAQSKHKVLAPRYISTSGSYYAIEPCTIHNFTLAHGS